MMSSKTPADSVTTPILLIRAMVFTPIMLIAVVNTINPAASSSAFLAPLGVATWPISDGPPMTWNVDEICGRTTL
jgi:hypothetical protein